jgi:sulfur carrier protein
MNASQDQPRSAARDGLTVQVNGEPKRLPAPCNIAELLGSLEMGGKRVAVAVNRDVVIRSRYAEVVLADGDRIEILEAVGGG